MLPCQYHTMILLSNCSPSQYTVKSYRDIHHTTPPFEHIWQMVCLDVYFLVAYPVTPLPPPCFSPQTLSSVSRYLQFITRHSSLVTHHPSPVLSTYSVPSGKSRICRVDMVNVRTQLMSGMVFADWPIRRTSSPIQFYLLCLTSGGFYSHFGSHQVSLICGIAANIHTLVLGCLGSSGHEFQVDLVPFLLHNDTVNCCQESMPHSSRASIGSMTIAIN